MTKVSTARGASDKTRPLSAGPSPRQRPGLLPPGNRLSFQHSGAQQVPPRGEGFTASFTLLSNARQANRQLTIETFAFRLIMTPKLNYLRCQAYWSCAPRPDHPSNPDSKAPRRHPPTRRSCDACVPVFAFISSSQTCLPTRCLQNGYLHFLTTLVPCQPCPPPGNPAAPPDTRDAPLKH